MACENGIAGERDARHGHSSAAFDQVVQDNSFRADWTGLEPDRSALACRKGTAGHRATNGGD
jgi:hypothetical protein